MAVRFPGPKYTDLALEHFNTFMAAHEIYAKQLLLKGYGYPLWRPDPHNEPAVEVADVGYIKNGQWVRLFNGSKTLGDESNDLGVPRGYYPLEVGKTQAATLSVSVPMSSENVLHVGAEATCSTGVLIQAGGGFSFKCSKEQGAVLILGDDADVRDALREKAFLRYILENHATWLAFSNQVHERGIRLNDLVLVTGFHKTSAWACAAFSGSSTEIGLNFQVGQAGVAQGGMSVWGSWVNAQSVEAHAGPPIPVRHLRQTTEQGARYDESTQDQICNAVVPCTAGHPPAWVSPPPRNQCVFLRGYKVCDKKTASALRLWRKKRASDGFIHVSRRDDKDGPGSGSSMEKDPRSDSSGDLGGSQNSPGNDGSSRGENAGSSGPYSSGSPSVQDSSSGLPEFDTLDSECLDQSVRESLDLCMQLNYDKEPMPLDLMLEYILENSLAELAVVHENDLIALLQIGQNANVYSDFEGWIKELAPRIFVEGQVGMLETTYRISLSDVADTTCVAPMGVPFENSQMTFHTQAPPLTPEAPSERSQPYTELGHFLVDDRNLWGHYHLSPLVEDSPQQSPFIATPGDGHPLMVDADHLFDFGDSIYDPQSWGEPGLWSDIPMGNFARPRTPTTPRLGPENRPYTLVGTSSWPPTTGPDAASKQSRSEHNPTNTGQNIMPSMLGAGDSLPPEDASLHATFSPEAFRGTKRAHSEIDGPDDLSQENDGKSVDPPSHLRWAREAEERMMAASRARAARQRRVHPSPPAVPSMTTTDKDILSLDLETDGEQVVK